MTEARPENEHGAAAAVHSGNAAHDGQGRRGWFIGHFIEGGDLRTSKDVEVKWGIHRAGDQRTEWAIGDNTTLCLLVSGRFQVSFISGPVEFTKPGDYVIYGPGVQHKWAAIDDSVVLTVRWPSDPTAAPRP